MDKDLSYSELHELIRKFSKENGARQVWKSWRDTMLLQGRNVAPERMDWDGLAEIDKALDVQIAFDVILDFMVWFTSHPHE